MKRVLGVLLTLLFASVPTLGTAAASSVQTMVPAALASRVDGIVTQWMADNSIANAEVAVAHKGALVASFAHGWLPSEPHPVGSLSKAITGVCIADLIAAKKLSFGDTLGTLLASFFKRNGDPADPRFQTITIEELLTHRSGLPKNAVNDELDHTIAASVGNATRVKLDSDPGAKIAYSDTGYLILGFVAEHVAKIAYAPLCSQVFDKVGLPADAAVIDQTLAARAPNGGWSMSAESYARFLYAFNDAAKVLSPEVLQWIGTQAGDQGNANGPCPRFTGAPAYGLGVCINRTAGGEEIYHDGLLHHDKYYPETGGSFFFVNDQGDAAVVIFSGENSGKVYRSLETAVMTAMRSGLASATLLKR